MHTPNKVGNGLYIGSSNTWDSWTATGIQYGNNDIKPYVFPGHQSGADSQHINANFYMSSLTFPAAQSISIAARMSDIQAEIGDQPFAIELTGTAACLTNDTVIRPFVFNVSASAYTSNWMTTITDQAVTFLPVLHSGEQGASWSTKAVIEYNDDYDHEWYAGVMFYNSYSSSGTELKGFLSMSARYDFSSVETYYRGR